MTRDSTGVVHATSVVVTFAAYLAGIVLLLLALLTTADVVGRYFFNAPIIGVFDLTHFSVLIMVFLGLGYCGFRGGHVAIELLYDRLNRRTARILDRLINLIGCILFVVIAWQTVVQSIDVKEYGEASQLLLIPYYPFYWLLALGALLFAWVMALRVAIPESEEQGE